MRRLKTQPKWIAAAISGALSVYCLVALGAEDLPPGTRVEQIVGAGTPSILEVGLEPGQFVRITVEQQQALDVTATLLDPGGRSLASASGFGLPSFTLAAKSTTAGRYRLELRSRIGSPTNARATVRLDPPRSATLADEEVARTLQAIHAADGRLVEVFSARGGPPDALLPELTENYLRLLNPISSAGEPETEAGMLQQLGMVYRALKDYDAADRYLGRSVTLWRMLGNWQGESNATQIKASVNRENGNLDTAIADLERLLAFGKSRQDIPAQRQTLQVLQNLASNAFHREDAINYTKQLLELEPSADTVAAAQLLEGIAGHYLSLQQLRTSLAYRERAVAIYEKQGQTKQLLVALNWLSSGYLRLGEQQRGLQYADRASALNPAAEVDTNVLMRTGQYERAIQIFLQKVSSLHEQHSPQEAGAWLNLADAYGQAKLFNRASEALGEALVAWPARLNPGGRIEFLAAIGMHYQDIGEHAKALNVFREYLNAVQAAGTEAFPRFPDFLGLMARTERDLGMLEVARDHLETAMAAREAARNTMSPDISVASFAGSRAIYETYIDVLMRLHARSPTEGYDARALAASERVRSYALMANVSDTVFRIRDKAEPRLLDRERTFLRQLNGSALLLRQAIAAGPAGIPKAEAARSEISRLTGDLELVRGEIRRSSPTYSALTQPASLSLEEIQAQVLGPDTILLEYFLSDTTPSYAWVVTPRGLHSFTLPSRSTIDAAGRRVRDLLTAPQSLKGETPEQGRARLSRVKSDYTAAAAAFSRTVLGPAADLLGTQRLLIVADGSLSYIPFGSLPDPKTGVSLIASHDIIREASASALAVIRRAAAVRKPPAQRRIALFADPVYDAGDERISTASPSTTQSIPESLQRALTEGSLQIPRLSFSRLEADSIMKTAPAGGVLRAVDFDASRNVVANTALQDFAVVHFATHSLVNEQIPSLSGIVLSLVDKQGKAQDGFLRLHEIYNLRLNADLVVLSACQTAIGKEVVGEGIIGLSRGFFYAGATRVIASLWTVDDRATAELMSHFYRKLLSDRMTPSAALRAAQLELRKSSRWASPYFWAGFELQGEWK